VSEPTTMHAVALLPPYSRQELAARMEDPARPTPHTSDGRRLGMASRVGGKNVVSCFVHSPLSIECLDLGQYRASVGLLIGGSDSSVLRESRGFGPSRQAQALLMRRGAAPGIPAPRHKHECRHRTTYR
jgi:hypothetical protein